MVITVNQLSKMFDNINSGNKPVFDCKIECLEKWQVSMFSEIVKACEYLTDPEIDGLTVRFSSVNGHIPESLVNVTEIL